MRLRQLSVALLPRDTPIACVTTSVVTEISNHSVCDTGKGCETNKTSYAEHGVYRSTGTYTGS